MKRFRLYSTLIVAVLVILLGYNTYCIVQLYKSIARQTTELVTQSLRDADLDEILNRAKKYPVPDSLPPYRGKQLSQSRSIHGDTLYIVVADDNGDISEIRKEPLAPGTNYSDIMVNEIGYGAHQTIGPMYPLDIADLDSLFRLSLTRKGIATDTAAIISVAADGRVIAGDPSLRRDSRLDSVSICYNIMTGGRYVAYYSSPLGYILKQMTGIIVSAAALVVIITVALWYLFRTVSHLRTIEEMKDDFVSNMTHELKTPIAIAYSANDALLNYDTSNDPSRKEAYLRIANRQLKRLSELVENILAMSMERRRTMRLRCEAVLLRPFVEEIAAGQRMRADKKITIDVAVAGDAVTEADRTHLANVLNNLIDNAIKYSGDSVRITVTGDSRGISVADDGIGIPAKALPYLFNKFYRVPHGNRQDVRGYGIGLYYVKSISEKMGWTVGVRSKEGEGSVFTINFNGDER